MGKACFDTNTNLRWVTTRLLELPTWWIRSEYESSRRSPSTSAVSVHTGNAMDASQVPSVANDDGSIHQMQYVWSVLIKTYELPPRTLGLHTSCLLGTRQPRVCRTSSYPSRQCCRNHVKFRNGRSQFCLGGVFGVRVPIGFGYGTTFANVQHSGVSSRCAVHA
jgi:hypothetical protein